MKKDEIKKSNEEIVAKAEEVNAYLDTAEIIKTKRLRSCSAEVIETEKYYLLRSYRTIVAFIEKDTDTLYDILRYVYGYTSTSAQHISKFSHDYGSGRWGCENRRTWLPI